MGNSSSSSKQKKLPPPANDPLPPPESDSTTPVTTTPVTRDVRPPKSIPDVTAREEEEERDKEKKSEAGSDQPETKDINEAHMLLEACLNGKLEAVKGLVSRGVPLDPPEILDPLTYPSTSSTPTAKQNFITPLIAAINGSQLAVVQYLISSSPALLNTPFQQYSESSDDIISGISPLMLACQRKKQSIIACLVAAEADTAHLDSDRNTILHYVCRQQQQQLQQDTPTKKKKKKKNKKALDDAPDDITSTLLLLQRKHVLTSDLPGHSNARNNTALHSLAYFNNIAAMKILLEVMYGERAVNCLNNNRNENNPRDDGFSAHPPPPPSLKTLLRNDVGMTPLHIAVLRNSHDMARLLLQYGFDPGVKERSGLDVFQLAEVVRIQHAGKSSGKTRSEAIPGGEGSVLEVLEAYKASRAQQETEARPENQVDDDDDEVDDEDGDEDGDEFDMNASSITFENTVDDVEDAVREGEDCQACGSRNNVFASDKALWSDPKSSMFRYANRTDEADEAKNTAIVVDLSTTRKANAYPKALLLTKKQRLMRAAASMLSLGRDDSVMRRKKKKKKKRASSPKKRANSPQKLPAASSRKGPQGSVVFGFGSTTTLHPSSSASPRRGGKQKSNSGGPKPCLSTSSSIMSATSSGSASVSRSQDGSVSARVTPAKHSRTAHSSQVHRGDTAAASILNSPRHLRARSGWTDTTSQTQPHSLFGGPSSSSVSTKVAPAPTVQRGHRGGASRRSGRNAATPAHRKNPGSDGATSSVKLPARMHTSPSGVLTITFS